jgi:hypothetical protein
MKPDMEPRQPGREALCSGQSTTAIATSDHLAGDAPTAVVLIGRPVHNRLASHVLRILAAMAPGLIAIETGKEVGASSTYAQAGAPYATNLRWLAR